MRIGIKADPWRSGLGPDQLDVERGKLRSPLHPLTAEAPASRQLLLSRGPSQPR